METLISEYEGLFILLFTVIGAIFIISAFASIIPLRSAYVVNLVSAVAVVGGVISLGDHLADRMVRAGGDWLVMSVDLPRATR